MSIPQRNTALVFAVAAVLSLPFLISVAVAVGTDDLEKFDLGDLADGETRTFETGDGEVVATREGDRVVVELPAGEGRAVARFGNRLDCDLADSDCVVRYGVEGNGDGTFVFEVRKDGEDGAAIARTVRIVTAGDGEGSGGAFVVGGTPRVRVVRIGDGDGETRILSLDDEIAEALATVETIRMMPVVVMASEGEIVLQCPEGDTTMTVGDDEADLYTCPKHGLMLEAVEHPEHEHGFHWRFDVDVDDEDGGVEL